MSKLSFTKKEIVEIGELINSVELFESKLRLRDIPDQKVKDKLYTQVYSQFTLRKNLALRYYKYVGKKGFYTPKELEDAKSLIRQKHHDYVNAQLKKYGCSISDFK